MPMTDDSQKIRDVYCLCAAWCGTCGALKPAMDALQIAGFRIHWVDIEDHDDDLEDIDIATFPTIIVADGAGGILFAGPVEPRMANLTRLLEGLGQTGQAAGVNETWSRVVRNLRR